MSRHIGYDRFLLNKRPRPLPHPTLAKPFPSPSPPPPTPSHAFVQIHPWYIHILYQQSESGTGLTELAELIERDILKHCGRVSNHKWQDVHLDRHKLGGFLINGTSGSSSEPGAQQATLMSGPANGNHSGISQLNQTASHILPFQFSYINWDVLGTLRWLPPFQAHSRTNRNINQNSAQWYITPKAWYRSHSLLGGEGRHPVCKPNKHSFLQATPFICLVSYTHGATNENAHSHLDANSAP